MKLGWVFRAGAQQRGRDARQMQTKFELEKPDKSPEEAA
jgi:hypothetical protein